MRVRLVRRPGQHGTKAYVDQYGDQLICVRYRYDEASKCRYKTIEIIVEAKPWEPKQKVASKHNIASHTLVGIRVSLSESDLQGQLRKIGALWRRELQVWELRYDQVVTLQLTHRIAGTIEELMARR